ncbi:MAG TPA: hypothetical protein VEA59_07430 [Patescibacteria group bacterium]|nr:hypothetical protein [Patescibacteria group bacterium]
MKRKQALVVTDGKKTDYTHKIYGKQRAQIAAQNAARRRRGRLLKHLEQNRERVAADRVISRISALNLERGYRADTDGLFRAGFTKYGTVVPAVNIAIPQRQKGFSAPSRFSGSQRLVMAAICALFFIGILAYGASKLMAMSTP